MKRILFITQNLNRTGSEMVLWYLLNNIDKKKYTIYVFCMQRGELYDLLPPEIQKSTSYIKSYSLKEKITLKVLKFLKKDLLKYQLEYINKTFRPDIWYVNTLAVPIACQIAKELNVKLITHFHELEYAYGFINSKEMSDILSYSMALIGCSEEVCNKLNNLGHQSVKLQNSFIDTDTITTDQNRIQSIKSSLGIQSDDFIWVVSGATTYMKGFDYIIPILEYFKNNPNVKIVWVGRRIFDGLNFYVKRVAETRFENRLFIVETQVDDYYNYLSLSNGLLLLSREESFSLVMLEAAYLGKPIVSFDVGIAKDFISDGMGEVIFDRNLQAFLEAMKLVQNSYENVDSDKLRKAARMYSVKNQMPKFDALLETLF